MLPVTNDIDVQSHKNNASGASIPSEIPEPLAKLNAKEKKVWVYVTTALHEVGLIHKTDAMVIMVICKTFNHWLEAEKQLDEVMSKNGGSWMVTTPNGFAQPHQIYYVAQKLKSDLLKWLPEAALTIPSFHKVVGESVAPQQDDMFGDPVANHRNRKSQLGMRLVPINGG